MPRWYNRIAVNTPQTGFLTLENVGKAFGARRALGSVFLTMEPGDVVAVTGRNGSGKSTLLKIVAGLLRPTHGAVRLSNAGKLFDTAERRHAVGYAAPDLALYEELTGRENLSFFARVRGAARLNKTETERRLFEVGLSGRGEDWVRAYSSGMRQRLRLAFALLADPLLLLLDEPSLALDESGAALVERIVARQKAAGGLTLLATNDRREAALGERVVVLGG
jgi:heme exporter protein A